jgi:hypothetical protein
MAKKALKTSLSVAGQVMASDEGAVASNQKRLKC